MAPRRGEAAEERRDGEAAELGEKISSIEGKFATLEATMEGRLGMMEEMLHQLVKAQNRIQISAEKEKGPNTIPNLIIIQGGEEALEGGAPHPQIHSGEALGPPLAAGGGGFGNQGGGPNGRVPRPEIPWAGYGWEGMVHMGPVLGGPTGYVGDGPNGWEGGNGSGGLAGGYFGVGGPRGGLGRGANGAHYGNGMEKWDRHSGWEHREPLRRGNFIPPFGGGRSGPPGEAVHHGPWGDGR